MASNKMLIDASHPEETRVVVVRGNKVEEFDFESENKKQIRGNIYLAKVTRVEPSLQAAFVDYGGNRHGFLAFSEIHPDYYQIPMADRQALLDAEAEDSRNDDDEDEPAEESKPAPKRARRRRSRKAAPDDADATKGDKEETQDTTGSTNNQEAGDASSDFTDADSDAANPAEAVEDSAETVDDTTSEESSSESTPESSDAASAEENDGEIDDQSDPKTIAAANETDDVISEAAENTPTADPAEEEAEAKSGAKDASDSDEEKPTKRRRTRRKRRPKADSVVAESAEDNASDHPTNDSVDDDKDDDHGEDDSVESIGADDAMEEIPKRRAPRRHYKIQEVIKRRQIILIQVSKEERGNKGAALTTYLSLAGRYSVLMPNTARGGGISRKITNVTDRKRLKAIASDLDVAQGMGVILRTAGASRTKAEITRDFEYLLRLWENVRNLTLKSTAPCLVYEEGSLVKRSIRDLYNKDISEILVSGDDAFREAKDFMTMLMPSHAKNVRHYRNSLPIFTKCGVESQLDKMFQPQVTLKSGGYLVINQTEALVAIDVNSGRSTRQNSIEETALQTNLEASDEVARQLRLRDLAGLIVIDYIDMDEKRNNRTVEKRLKDALKDDRARIQIGRISHFGLMEMSRQRMRASVLESTTLTCPTCEGVGHVRAPSSVALHVLRSIEEHLLKNNRFNIIVNTSNQTAFYILSNKRSSINDLEQRFGVAIGFDSDETVGSQYLRIEKGEPAVRRAREENHVQPDTILPDDEIEVEESDPDTDAQPVTSDETTDDQPRRKRRRRRGRSGARDEDVVSESSEATDENTSTPTAAEDERDDVPDQDNPNKRRRRGKRGGRGKTDASSDANEVSETSPSPTISDTTDPGDGEKPAEAENPRIPRRNTRRPRKSPLTDSGATNDIEEVTAKSSDDTADTEETPDKVTKNRRPRKKKSTETTSAEQPANETVAVSVKTKSEEPPARPRRNTRRVKTVKEEPAPVSEETADVVQVAEAAVETPETPEISEMAPESKKGGWWKNRGFFK